ncbi:MAG: 4Fe-4S binding protein [Anaerolineales bacterium]|nr:4Fe-4S binding protein [Anaerolineales bacterium]
MTLLRGLRQAGIGAKKPKTLPDGTRIPDILRAMADAQPYERLAERLDGLANGFPPAADGSHLRLLEYLFTPEEAALAAELAPEPETPAAIAARLGRQIAEVRPALKDMARNGLITAGRTKGGLGYGLMPFVVGFYEMQAGRMDAELAKRSEDYFRSGFRRMLAMQPAFHRVIPVQESVSAGIAVAPFETAAGIVERAAAWAVTDCICRKQTALIGRPCPHPVEVCMILSDTPGVFHGRSGVRELTKDGALALLRSAADAGLVHSVSNTREGHSYICNCCTCSCGILRGMAEGGMASVVAHSGFVCQVDQAACSACGLCAERCPFGAIAVNGAARVDPVRCAGCGVCTITCPSQALTLVRRAEGEAAPPPVDEETWRRQRLEWRAKNQSS